MLLTLIVGFFWGGGAGGGLGVVGFIVGVEFTTMPSNIHILYFNCGMVVMDRFSQNSRRSRIRHSKLKKNRY